MDWVEKTEEKMKEEKSKEYFNISEGENRFVLLSHCAPLAQKWTGSKYELAEEGDQNVSIKGLCWVLQENMIKSAKLPYTVVKSIRALQNNPDWEFTEFPFKHILTLNAKGAGTKEVEYSLVASPKEITIDPLVLEDLKRKPTPEDVVERIRSKSKNQSPKKAGYPEGPDPEDVPF